MDFGSQVGAKLGRKIEPRQAKTKEEKGSEGKGRERKRKGRDWKGKVWKSVDEEILRPGGEGFARPLGGDCTGISPPRHSWERERQRTRTFSGLRGGHAGHVQVFESLLVLADTQF